jgi:hypothetical protein
VFRYSRYDFIRIAKDMLRLQGIQLNLGRVDRRKS